MIINDKSTATFFPQLQHSADVIKVEKLTCITAERHIQPADGGQN
jgi:hypothetical protein